MHVQQAVRQEDDASVERAVEALRQRIAGSEQPETSNAPRAARSVPPNSWHRSAFVTAAIALCVAIPGLFGYRMLAHTGLFGAPSFSTTAQTYATASGQRATVTLADGSRVVLGPATTLHADWTPIQMTVTVQGKALFTVAHSSTRPFIVNTGRSTTRVLGTTFFVQQYGTDRTTQVAVINGRVSVRGRPHGASAVLSANTAATVNDSGQVLVTPNIVVNDYAAWATGVLVFHNAPAGDVVAELGRTYGVDLELSDSLRLRQRLTWSVSVTDQSLSDVLDGLALLLDVHVVRTDHVWRLEPGAHAVHHSVNFRHPLSREPQYGR